MEAKRSSTEFFLFLSQQTEQFLFCDATFKFHEMFVMYLYDLLMQDCRNVKKQF